MYKKLPIISFIIIGLTITYLISRLKGRLYEAKWNDNSTLAITIDGDISTTFPNTNAYEGTVTCTTGTGSVSWNGTKWILTTSGITKGSTKCNVIFNTTLAGKILVSNEVKNPISTPGADVSAYKVSNVTSSSILNLKDYQSYYITYGTGYEANGTKFNLTGTSVTTDTYVNSYSSLVGKYLPMTPDSIIHFDDFASSTAGTKTKTTNLSSLYYIVSATSNNFTYKYISSNKKATEALLASAEDDYGISYYFRGTVKNNYVQFANKCWRIIRIGGDKTVKLILHNDNTSSASNPCSSVNNSATAAFAHYNGSIYKSAFNSGTNDNAYVGFMYGTPGSRTYAATHANINKSTILTNLETWYNNNLKTYESVIDDNVFCNDKSVSSGLGYGTNETDYMAYKRLYIDKTPSLKCNGELSKITSKIGLITADELVYAGYSSRLYNTATYLQENAIGHWWTMSPYYTTGSTAFFWQVNGDIGSLYEYGSNIDYAVRPVISLISSAKVSSGSGTSENPYIVSV